MIETEINQLAAAINRLADAVTAATTKDAYAVKLTAEPPRTLMPMVGGAGHVTPKGPPTEEPPAKAPGKPGPAPAEHLTGDDPADGGPLDATALREAIRGFGRRIMVADRGDPTRFKHLLTSTGGAFTVSEVADEKLQPLFDACQALLERTNA